MPTEASAEEEEYTTHPKDWRQRRRRWGLEKSTEEYTTATEASVEEDEHKDYDRVQASMRNKSYE